jgi:CHAD domain-containing protein
MEPIAVLLERLSTALPLAQKGDSVSVKTARTTGRRLRVAIPLATAMLPQKLRQRLLDSTQTLTRSLGVVRDLDAQQELLKAAEATATQDEHRGFAFALRVLEKRRTQAMKRVRRGKVGGKWLEQARQAQKALLTVANEEPSATRAEVSLAAENALRFDTLIRDPKNITELHELRIAVKRLRFTLSRFPETEKALKKSVAALQTVLGTIHDLDILRLWLRGLESEKKRRLRPRRRERESLAVLRRRLQTERAQHYDNFRQQWELALPTLQALVSPAD